ncbi:MAG: hypothetical protein J1E99_04385 [Muribaculaceae bacterium]|nr:hypothetical protein [Muribaculaceae bacterium]
MSRKTYLRFFIPLLAIGCCMFYTACNSSSSLEYNYYTYSSTAVTSFSLNKDSKVLNNLDSVYFSIDLETGRIFNASPLPVGTNVSRLVVNITYDNCSAVELRFKTDNGTDTIVDYLENATDSINFSNGDVILRVTSQDELAQSNYIIKINIYDENPDSLIWKQNGNLAMAIPSKVVAQRTALAASKFFVLSTDGDNCYISSTDNPYFKDSWSEPSVVEFDGFNPVIESFTGTPSGDLYLIGSNNKLYVSKNQGQSWEPCDVEMSNIIGAYGSTILGTLVDDSNIYGVQYPSKGNPLELSPDFPVTLTGQLVTLNSIWQVNPQSFFAGGIKTNGQLSEDTWGFDGEKWARLSQGTMQPNAGSAMFPYTFAETDTMSWRVKYRDVVVKFGGLNAEGEVIDSLYYTDDQGLHWKKAPDNVQLSGGITPAFGSQTFTLSQTLDVNSRAIKPITSWECPFIYVFDGVKEDDEPMTDLWQGVLIRYTNVPLE